MNVLISYRRSDSAQAAHRLAETLERDHGQRVFIDSHGIDAGEDWRETILAHVRGAAVVLAPIGAQWAQLTVARDRLTLEDRHAEDVLRLEIETALLEGVPIVPVFLDDTPAPPVQAVARPFRPLLALQGERLRAEAWSDGVKALVKAMEQAAARPRTVLVDPAVPALADTNGLYTDISKLAEKFASSRVVTVLGPETNEGVELASRLAREFRLPPEQHNLALVSQLVSMTEGRTPLCDSLRSATAEVAPSPIHTFLAELPRRLRDTGHNGAQLIITTNYDQALERAFDAVSEPYDVALFIASGPARGRFAHIKWWDPEGPQTEVIEAAKHYTKFPFDAVLNLDRTVIVKLLGGTAEIEDEDGDLECNYVVTEDDHIGFLAQAGIETFVPHQLLAKIRRSHFLFLGYPLGHWQLRVFLQRVWEGEGLGARSTVVTPTASEIERRGWSDLRVDVLDDTLTSFSHRLATQLAALAPRAA